MGTTTKGIQYPDPGGVPSRSALQTLATSTDTAVEAWFRGRFRSGTTTVVTDGSGTAVVTVTLATAMAVAPLAVVGTVNSPVNDGTKLRIDSYTTTGFRLIVTGGAASTAIPIAWVASAMPS